MCWILSWVLVLKACFAGDLLSGRMEVSSLGNVELLELPCVMASFAR